VLALVERFEYEYGKKLYGIDYEQFAQWVQPLLSMDIEELHKRVQFLFEKAKKNGYDTRSLFEEIDQDNSGFISGMELKEALYEMGMPLNDTQIRCLVDEYDLNNDGKIQYLEFSSLFKTKQENQEEEMVSESESASASEEVTTTKKKKTKNTRNTFRYK
jgi:hypothetical protein